MNKKIKLYPYGFIFSDEVVKSVPEQYSQLRILDKYNYYFDNIYNPSVYETHTSFIIIHGHFVHINFDENISNSDFPNYLLYKYLNDYDEFLNTLDFIAGRFVIIIGHKDKIRVYPDASNTRSSYYGTDRLVVASHVHLIADNFKYEKEIDHLKVPNLNILFENSPYINIRSSIPNHYVDIHTKKSTRFFPRTKNKYTFLDKEEKFEMIENLWKSQLKYYNENFKDLILSLTGGNDSRFSLAMARELNQDIQFFTYSTTEGDTKKDGTFAKVLSIDQYIVRQILEDIPLNHKFFFFDQSPGKLSNTDVENLNRNSIIQHGRYILPFYMHAFPADKVMHVRGNLLEIARRYFHPSDRANNTNSVKSTLKYGMRKFYKDIGESTINDKIDASLNSLKYGEDLFDYHILDLFYWENRMGRWHSEVLNETDAAFDTLLPFNMRAIIDISLSFPVSDQRSGYLFKELVNRNHPILNFYGRNERENLYEKQRNNEIELRNNKNSLFKYFNVFDKSTDKSFQVQSNDSTMYIPEQNIKVGNYSEVSFTFNIDEGIAAVEVESKFLSNRGKKYLQYEIYKNGTLLLSEDAANWNIPNEIKILNMKKMI